MNVKSIILLLCFYSSLAWSQNLVDYTNLINIQNSPKSFDDKGLNVFFDLGSWMGFSLSEDTNSTGFSGPYLLGQEHGLWAANSFVTLELTDTNGNSILNKLDYAKQVYLPGKLKSQLQFKRVHLKSSLIFTSKGNAILSTKVTNNGRTDLSFTPKWKGSIFKEVGSFSKPKGQLIVDLKKNQHIYLSPINDGKTELKTELNNYQITLEINNLKPGQSKTYYFEIQYHPEQNEKLASINTSEISKLFDNNQSRWNDYLKITNENLTNDEKLVVTKSICTLINNWRSPAGELKHDGIFPSYHYKWFQGFWSWDSWKHAVAIVKINPELAKNQIRAMYDYQNDKGMIADCIFRDPVVETHNWRDTKPPLSSWAIWEIYQSTNDVEFLKELYPKVVKYHNWWYKYRDYDKDGLCEYGSTDGSLIAAKWESGMDNAIRFDKCKIVDGSNYSINTESVDLNSYLAKEKEYLSKIAKVLKRPEHNKWNKEAITLSDRIRKGFYDKKTGYFFDIDAESGQFLNDALGPEGWTPVWCEIATKEQAAKVVIHMLDTNKFNTKIPLPTIDVSHPAFDPLNGYWRGPVWLDQVWFGIDGLKKYGFNKEAKYLINKVIQNCEGLIVPGESIRENYHPLTGKGLNAEHFSWSAAHLILLLEQENHD